jgi:hypothetical protein
VNDPVTVTSNVPVLLETHESVEAPEVPSWILVGFREHASPLARVSELERFTVPARLLCDVTVIVELPLPPMLEIVTDVGEAPIVKSPDTVTLIAAVEALIALLLPPAPVMTTLYVPGVAEMNLQLDVVELALGTTG